jgi:hypothetical protein
MRIQRGVLAAAALALLGACGGGSGQTYNLTGSGSMTGTISSQPMTVSDAVSNTVSQTGGSAGAMIISSAANQCQLINARRTLKSGSALAIVFGIQSGNTVAVPTPGIYTVHTLETINGFQGMVAAVQFAVNDATCTTTTGPVEATGGTLTVTRVDATGYTGSFDLTFGSDHVTGTFSTGTCSALGTVTSGFTCPP